MDRLAIVDLCSSSKAVSAIAEVDLVQVELENGLLVQLFLDLERQQDLVKFPGESAIPGKEIVAGHLHGNGAAPGLDFPGRHQLNGGTAEPDHINAEVFVEAGVLRCQKGL